MEKPPVSDKGGQWRVEITTVGLDSPLPLSTSLDLDAVSAANHIAVALCFLGEFTLANRHSFDEVDLDSLWESVAFEWETWPDLAKVEDKDRAWELRKQVLEPMGLSLPNSNYWSREVVAFSMKEIND